VGVESVGRVGVESVGGWGWSRSGAALPPLLVFLFASFVLHRREYLFYGIDGLFLALVIDPHEHLS
jgi:hypothetical protein